MNRFAMLRLAVKCLRGNTEAYYKQALLDMVLVTMSPSACANAVFTALEINPDPKYWRFTR